ncbi:hypothetical protein ACVQ9Z_01905 [Staphylococcus aureus]
MSLFWHENDQWKPLFKEKLKMILVINGKKRFILLDGFWHIKKFLKFW